jgi:hypothetical protein
VTIRGELCKKHGSFFTEGGTHIGGDEKGISFFWRSSDEKQIFLCGVCLVH